LDNLRNYSLALVGLRPLSLAESHSSGQMLYAGLENEFKKLSHVQLFTISLEHDPHDPEIASNAYKDAIGFLEKLPKVDFMLSRCYTAHPIIQKMRHARSVRYERCSFIEIPQPTMDFTFGFLDRNHPNIVISCPYCAQFMINVPKIPKTVLFDDDCSSYSEEGKDLCKEIAEGIRELTPEYTFYQLSKDGKTCADYIKPVMMGNYQEYMERTSQIETFIQCHRGSYEHSVIDMAGRGIRVFIPNHSEWGLYINEGLVHQLKFPIFTEQHNYRELIQLIKEPVDKHHWDSRITHMTEMKDCVAIIDKHFQEVVKRHAIK